MLTPKIRLALSKVAGDARVARAALGKAYSPGAVFVEEQDEADAYAVFVAVLGEPTKPTGSGEMTVRAHLWDEIGLMVLRAKAVAA